MISSMVLLTGPPFVSGVFDLGFAFGMGSIDEAVVSCGAPKSLLPCDGLAFAFGLAL